DEATLTSSVWLGCELERCVFTGANLSYAELSETSLRGGVLRSADLSHLDALELTSSECGAGGGRFDRAELTARRCERSTLASALFDAASLDETQWEDTDLTGASFARASLENAALRRCRLDNARFPLARGLDVVFRGCDLSGALLAAADWTRADFRNEPELSNVLAGASFQGAILDGAKLTELALDG